jgi:subfamily B ATP-binding cassette protein MsbA
LNIAEYTGATAFKRISKIIDKKIKIKENKDLPELIIKKSDINFNNIIFKYDTVDSPTIEDINFSINGGTIAAFVGHSGAGKSTILNLLPRFYDPQDGQIKIDGQDISKVRLSSLRKNISLVSQDIILFDDTIKNNILYARETATQQEIENACEFAAATEFVRKMPNKFETMIGENGVRLSGGQKQRISIARAILKESPIILLDEATSSLDADSEEIVQNAIANLTKNKTTLVIAHRLSTIHNANKIFVLKEGKIVNSGKHDFLINNCLEYKSLYKKQLQ